MAKATGIYKAIIEHIFTSKFRPGTDTISFNRKDISKAAEALGVSLPKNIGDVLYSYRFRARLPESINKTAGPDKTWIIRLAGKGLYRFDLVPEVFLKPNINMIAVKVPDATPGIVEKYALSDEQALLAKVRYNRLLDVFLGIACYSLQNHLRTNVTGLGQIETDELYVGVDKRGVHYIVPVQAKGGADRLSIVQIEQDIKLCQDKFALLTCRPVAAQFMRDGTICLFEFIDTEEAVKISAERHYKLVSPEKVTDRDLKRYTSSRQE
jgi:hypothetical protein